MKKNTIQGFIIQSAATLAFFFLFACHAGKESTTSAKPQPTHGTTARTDSTEYFRKQSLKHTADEKLLPVYKKDTVKK